MLRGEIKPHQPGRGKVQGSSLDGLLTTGGRKGGAGGDGYPGLVAEVPGTGDRASKIGRVGYDKTSYLLSMLVAYPEIKGPVFS